MHACMHAYTHVYIHYIAVHMYTNGHTASDDDGDGGDVCDDDDGENYPSLPASLPCHRS